MTIDCRKFRDDLSIRPVAPAPKRHDARDPLDRLFDGADAPAWRRPAQVVANTCDVSVAADGDAESHAFGFKSIDFDGKVPHAGIRATPRGNGSLGRMRTFIVRSALLVVAMTVLVVESPTVFGQWLK